MKVPPAMRLAIDALATEGVAPDHIIALRSGGVFPPTDARRAIIVPWDDDRSLWLNDKAVRISDETWYLLRDVIEQFKPCSKLEDPCGLGSTFLFGVRRILFRRPLTREEVLACCTGPAMPRESVGKST
jgi:hypothetical protein